MKRKVVVEDEEASGPDEEPGSDSKDHEGEQQEGEGQKDQNQDAHEHPDDEFTLPPVSKRLPTDTTQPKKLFGVNATPGRLSRLRKASTGLESSMELSFGGRLRKKVNYKEVDVNEFDPGKEKKKRNNTSESESEDESEESDSEGGDENEVTAVSRIKSKQKTLDFSKFKHAKANNPEQVEAEREEANRMLRLSKQRRENEKRGAAVTLAHKGQKRNHSSSEENWSESSESDQDARNGSQGTRRSTRNINTRKSYKEHVSEEEEEVVAKGEQGNQDGEEGESSEEESSEEESEEDLPNNIDQLLGYRASSVSADGREWSTIQTTALPTQL